MLIVGMFDCKLDGKLKNLQSLTGIDACGAATAPNSLEVCKTVLQWQMTAAAGNISRKPTSSCLGARDQCDQIEKAAMTNTSLVAMLLSAQLQRMELIDYKNLPRTKLGFCAHGRGVVRRGYQICEVKPFCIMWIYSLACELDSIK